MNMVRLDTNAQPSPASALPEQILAARHRPNSVAPHSSDLRPPTQPESPVRSGLDPARDEVAGKNGERRPPPPLKAYASIPTQTTAEILRLQEAARQEAQEATKAEAKAENAFTPADASRWPDRVTEAGTKAAGPIAAERDTFPRGSPNLASGLEPFSVQAIGPSRLDHQA